MTINLIMGCMFSGKTSALINVAKMNKLLERIVLIINFNEDSRYSESNKITTHDGVSLNCVPCDKNILQMKSTKEYQKSEVICINEGQFFENLVTFCVDACREGKNVYICGLDGDFLKRPFGEILNLIPHCETVCKMQAICMGCKNGTFASFTKRTIKSEELVLIGSTESYIPVCRHCYDN